jgi:hypothetical protein
LLLRNEEQVLLVLNDIADEETSELRKELQIKDQQIQQQRKMV